MLFITSQTRVTFNKQVVNCTSKLYELSQPTRSDYRQSAHKLPTEWGRDSSFGIATRYGLDSPGIEYRWWAIFSVSVQTGPEAHPTPCTMVTGPFTGVKRPGGVVLTAHPRLQCRGLK